MSNIYINEPLTQQLPAFYNFMGGWSFVRGYQGLSKLVAAPRHWRGTKIPVVYKSSSYYDHSVQTTVYQDDFLVYCNHVNQELDHITFNDGQDDEYGQVLSVCQKCGDGWNEDGELLIVGEE